MKKTTITAFVSFIAAAFGTSSLQAATQGTLSAISTGSIEISLVTANQIRISNLQDIALVFTPGLDAVGNSPACVYRNGAGTYSITANGSGNAGAFTLSDGGVNELPYSLSYNDGSGLQVLTPAASLVGRRNANTTSVDCAAGAENNGNIEVTVASNVVEAAPAGAYSGTLTLIVSPE